MVTKKDKTLAAAQKFLERGQLDKALAEFAKVVQEDPKDTRTWLKMAELHAKRGAADQATEIYLKTGELYTEQGFFQKAVAVYKNVLKLSPSYVQGHFKLAEVFKRLGLVSDAVHQYELAAFAYQKTGRPTEALGALRAIVELTPDNVVSRIKLAELASQAGATDEAIQEFARAADQLKVQGRYEEYTRVAERLLFHQPDNLAVARELAEAYIDRNNARLALAKLQVCLKAEPRAPENVSLLARAFEQLDIPKAVSVLKELAEIHQELGHTAERDVAIRRALALEPRDRRAAGDRAALRRQRHRRRDAAADPGQLVAAAPADARRQRFQSAATASATARSFVRLRQRRRQLGCARAGPGRAAHHRGVGRVREIRPARSRGRSPAARVRDPARLPAGAREAGRGADAARAAQPRRPPSSSTCPRRWPTPIARRR